MKILHTADWHIGQFKGPEENGVNLRSEDTIKCLKKIVKVAKLHKPYLTLVAGDVFHQAEIWQGRSHKEVLQAREIILELSQVSKHVVVMRGTPNHDSLEAFNSLEAQFEFVDNVVIVKEPRIIKLDELDIAVLPGFDKGVYRAKFPGLSKEQENQVFTDEIGNVVTGLRTLCTPDKLSILMSHYTVPGCNTESGQTQFLTQFEPIISQDVLIGADYDLVALGHIHRPQQIPNVKNCFYSGAVNAMNFNDEGQERGCWVHEFELTDASRRIMKLVDSEFCKTPSREFLTINWDKENVEIANSDPEIMTMEFIQQNVQDKIVRIIYSCTEEQKKAMNINSIKNSLYEAGAFYFTEAVNESLEYANRTELSRFDDPEKNLVQYLEEKLVEGNQIPRILEKARDIIAKAMASESKSDAHGTFIPKAIAVKNYRNYVEQEFDFESIRFCTINGTNGAGKSSLFMDAILDCLFEEPREGSNTGWIRSDEKARSGSISFTFGIGDKTYRVVRTRAKSGKGTLNIAQLIDNEWIDKSMEKYKDTQQEIYKIVGMDSLTFKACVLIMQDQYGLFLEAGKDDRVSVISTLLGLDIYGNMQGSVQEQLSVHKRSIAAKKNTVSIHQNTILSFGDIEDELSESKELLNAKQIDLSVLQSKKEEKSILIKLQEEAENRRNKVQASINALIGKKALYEQNIASTSSIISSCTLSLNTESETELKVDEYKKYVEEDKRLVDVVAAYKNLLQEEKSNAVEIKREQEEKFKLTQSLNLKVSERNGYILESANDGEVAEKAKVYEEKTNELREANTIYRKYLEMAKRVTNEQAKLREVNMKYESDISTIGVKIDNCKKRAELLDSVQCVDIEQANCGFLKDAHEAKNSIDELQAALRERTVLYEQESLIINDTIIKLQEVVSEMSNSEQLVLDLERETNELRRYHEQMNSVNQRRQREIVLKGEIANIKTLLDKADERINSLAVKSERYAQELANNKEAYSRHQILQDLIAGLEMYVSKVATYPVIKEKLKNAQENQANEVLRLAEVESSILDAQKELQETAGATIDITETKNDLSIMDTQIKNLTDFIANIQQKIGSLNQKENEANRLKDEILKMNEEIKAIAQELSDYELLKAAFSQSGIPHQIIRTLVPKLTEVSSSILGQMTGGAVGINFELERMQKSGKETTALDIYIEEYGKSTLPYLSKSGGEKVRASLSVILALAEIKSSSAGINLGMLFIDEPPFLDAEGIQAYCDALETIQERYLHLKIMAITHDPTMKARFPQSLDVVKTESGSKVIY